LNKYNKNLQKRIKLPQCLNTIPKDAGRHGSIAPYILDLSLAASSTSGLPPSTLNAAETFEFPAHERTLKREEIFLLILFNFSNVVL
jgi:hypothetical protein